jgi:hypothetical protein
MEMNTTTIKMFNNVNIRQRAEDGYLSATDMCKVFGKLWKDYYANKSSKAYIEAVSSRRGIPLPQLVEVNNGNIGGTHPGTWVHPRIAVHLAQWLSPIFADEVSDWVLRYLSGDITLVKEIVTKHDEVNNVKTTQINFDDEQKRLELDERRANIERIKMEIEERKKRLEIEEIEARERSAERARKLEIDTVAACTPFLVQVEALKQDAHLYTAVKGYIINTMTFNNNRAIPNSATDAADNILLNKDISQIIVENGWRLPNEGILKKVGKALAKEYRKRYNKNPLSAYKHVNGSIRDVKIYPPADLVWIVPIINSIVNSG